MVVAIRTSSRATVTARRVVQDEGRRRNLVHRHRLLRSGRVGADPGQKFAAAGRLATESESWVAPMVEIGSIVLVRTTVNP